MINTRHFKTNFPYRFVAERDLTEGTLLIRIRLDGQAKKNRRRPDVDPEDFGVKLTITGIRGEYIFYKFEDGSTDATHRNSMLNTDTSREIFIIRDEHVDA